MYQRAQKDLKLTPEQLRGYFKFFPNGEDQPAPGLSPSPQPGAPPGTGNRGPDPCSRPKVERFHYEPLTDGRSQGAMAVLCPGDLKNGKKDKLDGVPVKGMPSTQDNAIRKGVTHFQKTHIIGDKFGGDPVSENLFPGYSRMNLSGMKSCESRIRKQLAAGNPVLYYGKLSRVNPSDDLPSGIQMTAYTGQGKLFDKWVANTSEWQVTCSTPRALR
ncbi:DNA/RNA non-specific endonuclease [Streptomyces sp. NRRL S-37]|uniref:DNA/RNA non-specific endonuclease n=1 Tax=Streptomyces sp. NRRL S-37 TaxID=1463903 RepID=UPI00131E1CEE|nr:DNA/RNA non-specific endonuclease [Streptomyces sp. NRRL S-37]